MSHNFSEQLLLKPVLPKDITQSQVGWAKEMEQGPTLPYPNFTLLQLPFLFQREQDQL